MASHLRVSDAVLVVDASLKVLRHVPLLGSLRLVLKLLQFFLDFRLVGVVVFLEIILQSGGVLISLEASALGQRYESLPLNLILVELRELEYDDLGLLLSSLLGRHVYWGVVGGGIAGVVGGK